ncbi:cysteinyl leukotriene receptor 1 [Pleuronectes platessa]|uniref:cysteinyl leukotriene receptor 1 n=1 Tax=Pleuronectes platessa TaxID=8262 RepID=UPI00232A093D|nr:cysteinyl leukotriene receptor 1 [Pleuronectes platessa]XP_053271838.1 cysteinyl leukotriene receptor 1 [Pleuronectes platessa]
MSGRKDLKTEHQRGIKRNGGNTQRLRCWSICHRMSVHLGTLPVASGSNTSVTNDTLEMCIHSDDPFKFNAYIITYLLVFPFAFLCNTGALLIFLVQGPRRGSSACVVMMNLALSDASFSLTLPLRAFYYLMNGVWRFPDWLCQLCGYSFYVNIYTSIFFLTLLSLLRWLAVTQPLRHSSQVTPTRTMLVCLGIWVFVGVSVSPFLIKGTKERSGSSRCFEPYDESNWRRLLQLNYVSLAVGFLFPLLTIIICYSSLIRHLMAGSSLSSIQSGNNHHHTRQRSVHLVSMVIVTFLFCFLPYHVMRSVHLHAVLEKWPCEVTVVLRRAAVVTLCLAALSSVVNPLLYYYSAKKFRNDLRDVLRSSRRSFKRRASAGRREPET